METNEIEIPVPWGIIAAKTWGNVSDPLVLAIHGWGDHANSFDPLIPLLPPCFYYVCIDLPGHGKSSPVETLILRDLDYVIPLKMVYNHFKRDKITIMAHSFAGFFTVAFTQFYPRIVSKIIIFDVFYFYPRSPTYRFAKEKNYYNERIKFLMKEKREAPTYTKEEIMKRMMEYRFTPLSRSAAEILIDRSIKPAENGKYRIVLAPNVKQIVFTETPLLHAVEIMQMYPIKCPHLIVMSSASSMVRFGFKKLHDEYKKNPNFEYHIVEGTHEVHIENPEEVAPIVSQFLLKHQNKL